ncbi:MAG: SRPBCC domain-containing protein [Turneriella sp.]
MKADDYQVNITVPLAAPDVFHAINRVTEWWTYDLEGRSAAVGDEFTVRFGDVHTSTQKLIEVIPGERIVWLVRKSHLNFVKEKSEWTNTKICFEMSDENGKTQVRFTHYGLVPQIACYGACRQGWNYYIKGSLYKLLTTGKGEPG